MSVRALCLGSVSLAMCAGASAQSSTAQYTVVFDATWSNTSHPTAYPGGAHFSPLVGGVHSSSVSFWEVGGIATSGMESMAEIGASSGVISEVNAAIADGDALEVVTGPGTNSPGMVQTSFEATSAMSQLTLVSMIAPSPDWFIGVSGLELMDKDGWIPEIVVGLEAYDSGTDAGVNFTSRNSDLTPHIPIDDFVGVTPFGGTPSLGTFTITLVSVEVCLADANSDGEVTPADFTAWIAAFNAGAPACDQNNDGSCTPADFTAWIANFNAGC